jgi:hypothetical protein
LPSLGKPAGGSRLAGCHEAGRIGAHEPWPLSESARPPCARSRFSRHRAVINLTVPHFVFTCPTTRMNVQHWSPDADFYVSETEYEVVVCKACTGLHFINRKTGKLFGQDDDE